MNTAEIIEVVMRQLRETVKSEKTAGPPIVVGKSTIIPIFKVSFGFGVGGGQGDPSKRDLHEGGGGGAKIEPSAFIMVTDRRARILPVKNMNPANTCLKDMLSMFIKGIAYCFHRKRKA